MVGEHNQLKKYVKRNFSNAYLLLQLFANKVRTKHPVWQRVLDVISERTKRILAWYCWLTHTGHMHQDISQSSKIN
jgi:hypothetical protein